MRGSDHRVSTLRLVSQRLVMVRPALIAPDVPDDEFDGLAARLVSWAASGLSPYEGAVLAANWLATNCGVKVHSGQRESLEQIFQDALNYLGQDRV